MNARVLCKYASLIGPLGLSMLTWTTGFAEPAPPPAYFNSPVTIKAGTKPTGIAQGDFNKDNKPDLVVTSSNQVLILINKGQGVFADPIVIAESASPGFVCTDDLNGDNKPDIIAVDTNPNTNAGTGKLLILLHKPNNSATFNTAPPVDAGYSANFVAVGDVNKDGKKDLVVTYFSQTYVNVFLGDGAGGFKKTTVNSDAFNSLGGISAAIADFNKDSKPDIAVTTYTASPSSGKGLVFILLNNGMGTWSLKAKYNAGCPETIAGADFNKDNNPDLVTADFVGKEAYVLIGNGNGTFAQKQVLQGTVGSNPTTVACGDFNQDNKADFAVSNYGDGVISVLRGKGDSYFANADSYNVGKSCHGLALADYNGDGRLDIATIALLAPFHGSGLSSPKVRLLLSRRRGFQYPIPHVDISCRPALYFGGKPEDPSHMNPGARYVVAGNKITLTKADSLSQSNGKYVFNIGFYVYVKPGQDAPSLPSFINRLRLNNKEIINSHTVQMSSQDALAAGTRIKAIHTQLYLPVGESTIVLSLDDGKAISETDEGNNMYRFFVVVDPKAKTRGNAGTFPAIGK